MDNVVTHVLGIHRRKVRKIEGNTGKYYEQIAAEEEIYEKTRINDERKRKEMDLFITRFRAKARLGGLVQSRVKSLEKMEKREKLEAIKTLEFAFAEKPSTSTPWTSATSPSHIRRPAIIRRLSISLGPGPGLRVSQRPANDPPPAPGRGPHAQTSRIDAPQSVAPGYRADCI
jgi:ATP-binding cassette subfamily F protein 3